MFLQVSSSVEGPGGVTAEAIFDRVEQIACERTGWRGYTSEDF